MHKTINISQRVRNISTCGIKKMATLATQLEDVISFTLGVPPFRTAEFVRKEICQLILTHPEIDMYSIGSGLPKLKEALARKLDKQKQIQLDPQKEILITCGAMEALRISLETIIDPGNEVILFSPSFPAHREQIILAGGTPIYVPLLEEENWRVDFTSLEKAITKKTKALIITSPNNPTGNVLTKAELEKIAQLAEQHALFVISDEAYSFLTYGDVPHSSALTMPQFRDRFIVCCSCSKEYTMSGWRVGYACANEKIIQQLQKVHDATTTCAPTVSQMAAIIAIEGPEDSIKQHHLIYEKNLQTVCARLDKLSAVFEYQRPQGTYYIFPKIKTNTKNDVDFCIDILKKTRVALVPGSLFGPTGQGHVRIVFATEESLLNEGFNRLEKYFLTSEYKL